MKAMGVSAPHAAREVFDGIVGEVVGTFEPVTEASPVAMALQFLVAIGNAVGRQPHFQVGETRHGLNEFVAIVGRTSSARKGDGKNAALRAIEEADPQWTGNIASGLSSG